MSAGRRGLLLSAAFLGAVACLCPAPRAHAQPRGGFQQQPYDPGPGRHSIWQHGLSAEQIRQLLSQFGKGDSDAAKQLEDLIRDRVLQKNPKADKERVDATIKQMMADKQFMDRMMDLAQKHKNENPNQEFKLTPEAIEKLKNLRPGDGKNADPFKMPKFDPKQPFDPNNFDQKDFPHLDPDDPPRFDPNTKRLVNPKDGKALDPRTGQPAGPNVPVPEQPPPILRPKGDPDDTMQPKVDPNTGRPPEPPAPKPKFDPDNPFGAKDSPEKIAKQKAAETATALWEKNVGPIEESPAVKRAILDLVSDPEAMDALTDAKGNSIFDAFRDGGADGDGMKDLFGGGGDGGKWEWPKLDLKLDWGNNRSVDVPDSTSRRSRWPDTSSSDRSPRSGGSSMGGMGSFDFGGMQVPWLLALVLMAMIAGALLWWKWEAIFPPRDAAALLAGGVGAWPIDPREINTRDDIVKAFEYLSVLICGAGAKTWTHSTIADELSALARTHGDTAVKLARLYELARYAPLDEPLTRAEILEARRLACDLAGVDEA